MTQPQPVVPAPLLPAVQSMVDAYNAEVAQDATDVQALQAETAKEAADQTTIASDKTTISSLTAANSTLSGQVSVLQVQVISLQQQLAALQPAKPKPVYGAAATSAASYGGLGVTLLRQYYQPDVIPAAFKTQFAGAKSWVISIKPDINLSQGAAVTAFAKTLPAGCRLIIQHEPENKTKGITPAQFAACYEFYAPLVKTAIPSVKVGQCFMAYTSNSRPVDAVHTHAGQNEWLTAGCSGALKPDFVLWDGYVYNPNYATPAATFEGPRKLADALVPGIEQGIAEVGADGTGAARAAWFTSLGAYVTSVGFSVVCLFDEGANLIDNDPPTLAAWKALAAA